MEYGEMWSFAETVQVMHCFTHYIHYRSLIGNHIRRIEWYHLQVPTTTRTPEVPKIAFPTCRIRQITDIKCIL